MAQVAKDPAIKLFGRTISLHEVQLSENSDSLENESSMVAKAETENCGNENSVTTEEAASLDPCKAEQPQISPAISNSKAHHEESDDSDDPKSYKKPDKILPCPRCHSSDTKFCYFNNYNVNQPRHFCKSCQRYWTAGGTVRNVPVGAGRRRNKHLTSQYRQLLATSSDMGPTTMVETSDPRHQLLSREESASSCTTSSPTEMVLKFGPESPHCHSAPNLLSQSQSQRNGCSNMDLHNYSLCEKERPPLHPHDAILTPNSNGCEPYPVPRCTTQQAPNISVQFVPASYWNYIPVWVAGSPPLFSNGNGIQVLGKHSRDSSEGGLSGEGMSSTKARRVNDLSEA